MALKLPDSAVPMGDFPVAKAVDIDFDDGENLQEKLDDGKLGGAGGGNVRKVFYGLNELNNAKETNISLVVDEDNTEKIMSVLAPHEVFVDWFRNDSGWGRFGINPNLGTRINFLLIQKYNNDNDGVAIAITDKGKVLNRFTRNNILYNWEYDITISQLETQVSDLFQSVSDGKTLVANAITDKGVSTATNATFATMASNISKINTNGYKEETASWDKTSTGANRIVFTFSADVIAVKQVTPPSDASSHIVPDTSTSMFTVNGNKLTLYVNGRGTWKVTAIVKNA